jgi:hypothetical protein
LSNKLEDVQPKEVLLFWDEMRTSVEVVRTDQFAGIPISGFRFTEEGGI